MTYNEAIQELKAVRYCNANLIRLNQDIEVLEHQMTGLAHSGPSLSPEQARSPLPMPSYQHDPNRSTVALIEAKDAKVKEAVYYRLRILKCNWIEKLHKEDQNILVELYLLREPYDATAAKYGYSSSGLWKHLHTVLKYIGIS